MSDLWSATTSISSDSAKTWRGSSFKALKDFNIVELYLRTETPSSWDKASLWEVEESTGKILSKLVEATPSARNSQAYINANGVEIKKGKVYLIVFRSSSEDAKFYFTENENPITNELYQAMTSLGGTSGANYGSGKEPAIGASATGNRFMVGVGFTIGKPKKYFEMCPDANAIWGNSMSTIANYISVKQDVVVTAMEWLVHPAAINSSNTGTAKIWDENGLLVKGQTTVTDKKGAWVRSEFTSPVALEQGKAYYVGFSATALSEKENPVARDIYSNDGSLLISVKSFNYRVQSGSDGDVDIRPNISIQYEFAIRMYVEVNSTRFLIDSDGTIKKLSESWVDVGTAPVTDQMFKEHGMVSLNGITAGQWQALPKNSKILAYSEDDKVFKASISRGILYNSEDKLYRGTGMIETDTEELPAYRKTLVITADHQECTFQYSLDNGSTWNAFQSGDVIDVSKQSGKQLKIRINLPTDSAILTAISYAWA